MTNKSIYDMALHETTKYGGITILRVPGGWIYGGVFVPHNDEFVPEKECDHESISFTSSSAYHTCNDCGATRQHDKIQDTAWINNKPGA